MSMNSEDSAPGAEAGERAGGYRHAALPWMILLVGVVLSLATYPVVLSNVERNARGSFEAEVREVSRAIELRLTSYTDLLRGLKGYFESTRGEEADRFSTFVSALDVAVNYPAIRSINFAQQVANRDKAAFEASMRARGNPAFRILPPGERPAYQVLVLAIPAGPNSRIGFDLRAARPERVAELDDMRDRGVVISSGSLVPGQKEKALAMRAPVYRGPHASVDERRDSFAGTIGIGFSLPQLLQESVPAALVGTVRIRLHSLGNNPERLLIPNDANLLIDSAELDGSAGRTPGDLSSTSRFEFGGSSIAVVFEGDIADFTTRIGRASSVLIPVVVLTIALLLFAYIRALYRKRDELEFEVRQRTVSLRRTNDALEQEMDRRIVAERGLVRVAEEERRKIGEELHEDLGQKLTALGFMAESLVRKADTDRGAPVTEIAAKMVELSRSAVLQTRTLSHGLYLPPIQVEDLPRALQSLARNMSESYSIRCRYSGDPEWRPASAEMALHLYRISFEAIHNAAMRGRAKNVQVELTERAGRPQLGHR
jgi:hypothetical protein